MKTLIDQNISFRLVKHIIAAFPEVNHVKSLDLTDANDHHIFMSALCHYKNFAVMTVSIQFKTQEEFKFLEPFLAKFRETGLSVQVSLAKRPARRRKKQVAGLSKKLHGVMKLPTDFDYKSFLGDEILSKHSPNG